MPSMLFLGSVPWTITNASFTRVACTCMCRHLIAALCLKLALLASVCAPEFLCLGMGYQSL